MRIPVCFVLVLVCAASAAATAVCPTTPPAAGSCTVGVAAPTSAAANAVIAANSGGGGLALTSPPSASSVSAGNVCYRLAVPCASAAATFSSATGLDGSTCPAGSTLYLSSYVPFSACNTLLNAYPADLSVCTASTSDCNAVPSSAGGLAARSAAGPALLPYAAAAAFAAVL